MGGFTGIGAGAPQQQRDPLTNLLLQLRGVNPQPPPGSAQPIFGVGGFGQPQPPARSRQSEVRSALPQPAGPNPGQIPPSPFGKPTPANARGVPGPIQY